LACHLTSEDVPGAVEQNGPSLAQASVGRTPTGRPQHFRYRVLATDMREFLRRRLPGPPGTRPVSGYPETRTRTLGLTEMQIKDTGGTLGVSAWVSAAHPLAPSYMPFL